MTWMNECITKLGLASSCWISYSFNCLEIFLLPFNHPLHYSLLLLNSARAKVFIGPEKEFIHSFSSPSITPFTTPPHFYWTQLEQRCLLDCEKRIHFFIHVVYSPVSSPSIIPFTTLLCVSWLLSVSPMSNVSICWTWFRFTPTLHLCLGYLRCVALLR